MQVHLSQMWQFLDFVQVYLSQISDINIRCSASLEEIFLTGFIGLMNSETGGHGIGLSMANAIVEAHKGKISAEVTGDDGKLRIKAVL